MQRHYTMHRMESSHSSDGFYVYSYNVDYRQIIIVQILTVDTRGLILYTYIEEHNKKSNRNHQQL